MAETKETLLREILEKGFGGDGDLRALREKLAVADGEWEAVLRGGTLSGEVLRLGRTMAELCAPWVWGSLLRETKDGSVSAMKLYFELCKPREESQTDGVTMEGEIAALRQAIFAPQTGVTGEGTGDCV